MFSFNWWENFHFVSCSKSSTWIRIIYCKDLDVAFNNRKWPNKEVSSTITYSITGINKINKKKYTMKYIMKQGKYWIHLLLFFFSWVGGKIEKSAEKIGSPFWWFMFGASSKYLVSCFCWKRRLIYWWIYGDFCFS